jgi:phosphoribosylanthranilate isomerase
MTRVKICGITNLEDALAAVELGADELGFNFYDKSPRYVSPHQAAAITMNLPDSVLAVGVFVNESQERILETVAVAGLDAVQLHGGESHAFVALLNRATSAQIIKVIRPKDKYDLGDIIDFDAHAILVDSYSPDEFGGTGRQVDLELARDIWTFQPCVYLAGGLAADNVGDAIRQVWPYAVDACSRLELSPGKKDRDRVAAFIAAAKGAL